MACEVCHKPYVPNTDDPDFESDAKPHVCSICGESFSLKIQLKRHAVVHDNGASYVCKNCSANSSNQDSAKSYNLRLSKKIDSFVCDTCPASFSSKDFLNKHNWEEHSIENDFESTESSDSSDSTKPSKKRRKIHKKRKTLPRKSAQKAESPEVLNNSSASVANDLQLVKTGQKKLSCQDCNRSFSYQACLSKHIRKGDCKSNVSKDSNGRSDANEDSSSLVPNKNDSSSNKVKESNNSSKKYECHYCDKSFARKSGLEGHELIHIQDAYEDGDEEENFAPKGVRIHKSYACNHCNYVCFSETTLERHLTNHTVPQLNENTIEQTKKCPKCDETFESPEHLEKHSLIHIKKDSENKVFSCAVCSRMFYTKGRLKRHLRLHEGTSHPRKSRSKDFSCSVCSKRFAGETCLRKHERKHHGEEPASKEPSRKTKAMEKWVCEFCHEEFEGKRSAFIKHRHTHTPEVCGICDERFVDRESLREHCKVHIGTEEGKMFMECSQKHLDAKNGMVQQEPKVEYIYLVLR